MPRGQQEKDKDRRAQSLAGDEEGDDAVKACIYSYIIVLLHIVY